MIKLLMIGVLAQLVAGGMLQAAEPARGMQPAQRGAPDMRSQGDPAVEQKKKKKADSFSAGVEREMKESGEKGGTEDINIGVGELQE